MRSTMPPLAAHGGDASDGIFVIADARVWNYNCRCGSYLLNPVDHESKNGQSEF